MHNILTVSIIAPAPLQGSRTKQVLEILRYCAVYLWSRCHGLHHQLDRYELGQLRAQAPWILRPKRQLSLNLMSNGERYGEVGESEERRR